MARNIGSSFFALYVLDQLGDLKGHDSDRANGDIFAGGEDGVDNDWIVKQRPN